MERCNELISKEIIDSGLGYIPEDRHKRAYIKFPLYENSILGSQRSKFKGYRDGLQKSGLC